MPPLQKTKSKLLRQVGGKLHATQDDHQDPLPTPPPSNSTRGAGSQVKRAETEEEILAEPRSESDDERRTAVFKLPSRTSAPSSQDSASSLKRQQLDGPSDATSVRTFKRPPGASPGSTGSERSAASEQPSSDSELIFASQSSPKKRRKHIHPSPLPNIHAKQVDARRPRFAPEKTYAKSTTHRKNSREEQKPKFKQQKKLKEEPKPKKAEPVFKRPAGTTELSARDNEGGLELVRRAGDVSLGAADAEGYCELSPSLSSLSSPPSSPGVEEIAALDLPDAGPYVPTVECTICGTHVELFLKQEFEDQYNRGKQLNYRWQQRFCRYHKQHSARQTWKDRGYPDIDWDGFRARLQKRNHTSHLRRIISGETESVYRMQLEKTLKKGGNKSLLQAASDMSDKKGASVGYYGPRGEKLMTEHVLANFADALRDHATKDRLVSVAGVSGGVSGFVQAVLVPELAVSLVSEDLGSTNVQSAVAVLVESAELGELLHPEQEDKMRVAVDDEDEFEDD
ncbi:hypothetical protein LTR08_005355 [Meristemomyces frigidus]|nr:hypothetical protein LTR08_005355 [Meristemomyces frigidus]